MGSVRVSATLAGWKSRWVQRSPAPMLFLLDKQLSRQRLETRSLLAILLTSALSGLPFAYLLGTTKVLPLWGGTCALLLFVLLRAVSDGSHLYSLVAGGAWREIRLSRLPASAVIDAIVIHGMRRQMFWAVWPAIALSSLEPTWGLPWLGAVLLLSLLASTSAQLSQVHRVSAPFSSYPLFQRRVLLFGPLLLALAACSVPWGLLIPPSALLWAYGMRCNAAACLSAVGEGFSPAAPAAPQRQGNTRWTAPSENPIVMRECARESARVGRHPLAVWFHLFGGTLAWSALAVSVCWSMSLETVAWQSFQGTSMLVSFMLGVGLLSALRAGSRVFGALSQERDRQTLDLLVVTAMDHESFVDGWAEVGSVTRQLEVAITTLVTMVASAYLWQPSLGQLAYVMYAGLLGVLIVRSGAYLGLLLGFRHCMRRRRKRDWILPGSTLLWVLGSWPLMESPLSYLLVQALAAWLVGRLARSQAQRALLG